MVAGMSMGMLVAPFAASLFDRARARAPRLASPDTAQNGAHDDAAVSGELYTTLKRFALRDAERRVVLEVEELRSGVELAELSGPAMHVGALTASGVTVALHRGKSGRVTLAEVLAPSGPNKTPRSRGFRAGPVSVRNARLVVAVGERLVVIRLDQARVRVQQNAGEPGPRVFLSDVQGALVRPAPPKAVVLHGAEGVVDLAGGTLVDLRTRVCIGESEMRMRIEMPQRRAPLDITVAAEGVLGKTAVAALELASWLNSEALSVRGGAVDVRDSGRCASEGARDATPDVTPPADARELRSADAQESGT